MTNIIAMPGTIHSPQDFLAAPPHSFDGPFHWEYINAVLRPIRGIQCADIDCATEINGLHLHIETSDNAEKFADENNGQNRRTAQYLRRGGIVQLDIVGKVVPVQWRFRRRLSTEPWTSSADGRAEIAARIERWAHWANRLSRAERDWIWLQAAWEEADRVARQWLIEHIARTDDNLAGALGDYATTPLGQRAIQRVKALMR